MSDVRAAEIKAFIGDRFAESLSALGVDPANLPDDYDLLTEGIIDSFGILELVLAIGERFEIEIDYEAIDPQDLTVVGPLSAFVERQAAGEAS